MPEICQEKIGFSTFSRDFIILVFSDFLLKYAYWQCSKHDQSWFFWENLFLPENIISCISQAVLYIYFTKLSTLMQNDNTYFLEIARTAVCRARKTYFLQFRESQFNISLMSFCSIHLLALSFVCLFDCSFFSIFFNLCLFA